MVGWLVGWLRLEGWMIGDWVVKVKDVFPFRFESRYW